MQVVLSIAAAIVAFTSITIGARYKLENSTKLYALTFMLVFIYLWYCIGVPVSKRKPYENQLAWMTKVKCKLAQDHKGLQMWFCISIATSTCHTFSNMYKYSICVILVRFEACDWNYHVPLFIQSSVINLVPTHKYISPNQARHTADLSDIKWSYSARILADSAAMYCVHHLQDWG